MNDEAKKRRSGQAESHTAPGDPAEVQAAEGAAAAPEAAQRELAELKDKYLRLAAEFDNFRKRAIKDRTELWVKAQADLVQRLVDGLDDLARFAHVDPAQTDAKTLHEGVELVERKVWKELAALGVRRVDETGVPFDPQMHEAVATVPAADPSQDHTVGAVLQAGYKLGSLLLRPARVQVLTWKAER